MMCTAVPVHHNGRKRKGRFISISVQPRSLRTMQPTVVYLVIKLVHARIEDRDVMKPAQNALRVQSLRFLHGLVCSKIMLHP